MAEAFPVSGNIDPTAFPHLLVDLHRRGATGSLKVNGPVHPKALYFRSGRILFGSSNDPRDQLGAILIESGRITREQLDDVNAKVGPGNPLAKVLAESGYVNQRELGDAARIKVERILADLLSWESGSFEFEDGVLPKGAVDLKLSTERLLLAAVQRVPERAFALRHLGALSVVLEPAPDGEAALSEVRAEVWPLLERLDGHRTLKDAIALTRLDDFEAAKIVCAMLFLGIVRRAAPSSDELDLAQEARIGFEGASPPAEPPAPGPPPPEPLPPGPAPLEPPSAEPVLLTVPMEPIPDSGPAFPAPEPEPEPVAPPPLLSAESAGFAFADEEQDAGTEIGIAPPPPIPSASSVTIDAARPRPKVDTVPGDQPAYAPPPSPTGTLPPTLVWAPPSAAGSTPTLVAEPMPPAPTATAAPTTPSPAPPPAYESAPLPPPSPEPAPPPTTSRPSREDLAALDALLNPTASGQMSRAPERPRTERWEPHFRPAPPFPRRPAPQTGGSSKIPLVAAGLAAVTVAGFAAWYFLLRTPIAPPQTPLSAPVTSPTVAAPETLSSAATSVPSVMPSPAAIASPMPTPVPTPASTPPLPRATPAPAVAAQPPPPTGGDAHTLLRGGSLQEAARSFASTLSSGARGRFSVQLLVACAPETVQKAVSSVASEDLFILPVVFKGRACYRMCWGVYDTRQAAEAALAGLPIYFSQGGATPRLQPLTDLLP